jgi:hypothetical protein
VNASYRWSLKCFPGALVSGVATAVINPRFRAAACLKCILSSIFHCSVKNPMQSTLLEVPFYGQCRVCAACGRQSTAPLGTAMSALPNKTLADAMRRVPRRGSVTVVVV